jgi:hypothetical protein
MKVLLTYPPVENVHPWEGAAYVESVTELFNLSVDRRGHALVDSPDAGEIILYLAPNGWKDRSYAEILLRQDYIRRFPGKCFVYNYAPFFMGFLPGIYANLDGRHPDQHRFASWSYLLGLPNPFVEKVADRRNLHKPSLLFSFRGVNTAGVRKVIFSHKKDWGRESRLTEVESRFFFNLSADQQREYAEEIFDTRFVLCPRGLGCNSHRLFETMALGRVPVILSDAWVEPTGPKWSEFSIRVAERDVPRLPELLQQYDSHFTEMGWKARQAWETWFAPEVRIPRFFDRLEALAAAQPTTPTNYAKLWRSWSFYRPYGLAPEQKIWRNLRNGKIWKKLFRRNASV